MADTRLFQELLDRIHKNHVKDSKVLPDVFPGQPIRFEPTEESKYEEVSTDLWKITYLVQADEVLYDPSSCMHSIDVRLKQNAK